MKVCVTNFILESYNIMKYDLNITVVDRAFNLYTYSKFSAVRVYQNPGVPSSNVVGIIQRRRRWGGRGGTCPPKFWDIS